MARDPRRGGKKKVSKNIAAGVAHVNSSFNNTKILISDVQGNAIAWSSAGTMGFKGSRKSTPYAAQMAAEDAGKKAQEHGVKTLEVEVQGPGSGRETWGQDPRGRGSGPRLGPGKRPARPGRRRLQHHVDPRRDADRPQRLPPAEAPSRLRPADHLSGTPFAGSLSSFQPRASRPTIMGTRQELRRHP